MPRSRGRSAPAPRQQTRSSHTMAAPAPSQQIPQHVPQAGVQQRQPGLFAQMASTAAGVAVGSAVGHTLANGVSSIFGGGSSSQPAPVEEQQYQPQQIQQQQQPAGSCDMNARSLTECLDQNNGDMNMCQWYSDQLRSCLNSARTF